MELGARRSLWKHIVFGYIVSQTCSIPKLEPRNTIVGSMEGRNPRGNFAAHPGIALL